MNFSVKYNTMKRLSLIAVLLITALYGFGQDSADTTQQKTDTAKNNNLEFSIHYPRRHQKDDEHSGYPKASIGITIARLDLGFSKLMDNGSFTLRQQNQFLSYRAIKTSNVGFDVLQMGIRFSHNFRIYIAGGFDWTLIRLRDNVTILPHEPVLTYRQDNIDYSKNRFSSSYLRIPLGFDFRTNEDKSGHRWHFVFGPDGGFLLNGRVKQISKENGKQKIDDTYHFATFRYGAYTRIGYGDWGLFAKYYFNDMFENSPQQAGLKDFAFGVMLGF